MLSTTRFVLVAGLLASPPAVSAQLQFRTVALTGDSGSDGSSFFAFDEPVIDGQGRTAFFAQVDGIFGSMWHEDDDGVVTLVGKNATPATDAGAGVFFASFGRAVSLSPSGALTFAATLQGGSVFSSNNSGVFSTRTGSPSVVARECDAAPSAGGATFTNFDLSTNVSTFASNSDRVAFRGGLSGTGVTTSNDTGIWTDAAGALSLVAREDDPAPGTTAQWGSFEDGGATDRLALNGPGQIAFNGFLKGDGIDVGNNEGIWLTPSAGATPELIVRRGSFAPGASALFSDLSDVAINDNGQMVFRGSVAGSLSRDKGLWRYDPDGGGISLVAREQMGAPGTSDGIFLDQFGNSFINPFILANGDLAFRATLRESAGMPETGSIWKQVGGSLELVTRDGDDAPGTTGTFEGMNTQGSFFANDLGQVAFMSRIVGDGIDGTNNEGIWATTTTGELILIALEDTPFEVAPGDFRVIDDLFMAPSANWHDSRGGALNNNGELTFRLLFTDGSEGIFVTTIPTPGATVLMPLAGLMAVRRRR